MFLKDFMGQFGEKFTILRDNQEITTVVGMRNSDENGKKFIDFYPGTDVQHDDWVKALSTNEELYIDDTLNQMGFEPNEVFAKEAYYLTKTEYERLNDNTSNPTFNIHNAYGSVIGIDNTANIHNEYDLSDLKKKVAESSNADKEEIQQLVNLLELIVQNKLPAKEGVLSKFSNMMQKHSWITGAISSTIIRWLTKG